MSKSLLNLNSVIAKVDMSRSSIYKLIRLSDFPKPIAITKRKNLWDEEEIDQWIENRLSERSL